MIKTKHDNQYLSYILEDNSRFSPTIYRVLKKQKDRGFIPCSQILFNGHIKLLYPIGDYVPVSKAAENWNLNDTCTWMLRVLQILQTVQENGFIQLDTVDLDPSHIFLDARKETVHIAVLPLTVEASGNGGEQLNIKIERTLITMIEMSQAGMMPEAVRLKSVIRSNISSLDSLYRQMKKAASDFNLLSDTEEFNSGNLKKQNEDKMHGNLYFVSKSSGVKVNILINKEPFILGKNPRLVDGVLGMSPTISRKHCVITYEGGQYYIEDLDSVNHTYVNGTMVKKGEKCPINPGDQIRLAEVEFAIEYRA